MRPRLPRRGVLDIDDADSPDDAARQAIARLRDTTCQQVVIVIRPGEWRSLGVPVRVPADG